MQHPVAARITFDHPAGTVIRSAFGVRRHYDPELDPPFVGIIAVVTLATPATLRFIDRAAALLARTADLAHSLGLTAELYAFICCIASPVRLVEVEVSRKRLGRSPHLRKSFIPAFLLGPSSGPASLLTLGRTCVRPHPRSFLGHEASRGSTTCIAAASGSGRGSPLPHLWHRAGSDGAFGTCCECESIGPRLESVYLPSLDGGVAADPHWPAPCLLSGEQDL